MSNNLPSISGFLRNPLKVKSPVASPLIFDKTSSPKGLKAFNSNSSRLTLTSIFGLVSEKSNEQEINFKGTVRDSTFKNIDLDFTNVYLKSFLPTIDSLKLKGKLDGTVTIYQKEGVYGPKGNLSVEDFEINNFKQGDLSLNIEGESSYEKYDVNFSLEREQVKSISAIGSLDFSAKALKLFKETSSIFLNLDLKKGNTHPKI
ncbi:hypothetical protein OAP68_02195 [Flavobacteriaceae bacterium]|nr:hypothetical protein [Flavobacteriaceae bacterium]